MPMVKCISTVFLLYGCARRLHVERHCIIFKVQTHMHKQRNKNVGDVIVYFAGAETCTVY